VSLQVTWTGSGPIRRDSGSTHTVSPGGTVVVHAFQGTIRAASATGLISDGTTNFIPKPSVTGQLERSSSTSVTVSIVN
jgi:hypothetical protein